MGSPRRRPFTVRYRWPDGDGQVLESEHLATSAEWAARHFRNSHAEDAEILGIYEGPAEDEETRDLGSMLEGQGLL